MTKSLKSLWGRFLFRDRGIIPTKRIMLVFGLLSLTLLVGAVRGISWGFILTINGLVFLVSLIDLLFSPKKNQLSFNRILPEEMERGLPYTIQLEVNNHSQHSFSYRMVDNLPQSFVQPFPIVGMAAKEAVTEVTYETTASVRGKYEVTKLFCRYRSFIGLWEKQTTVDIVDTVKVIPDLTETKQYLANAQQFLIYEGLKIRKQRSGVGEFSKIRSYVVGDDPRKINWRQTAKLQEVMTNEYEPEHGKYITILLDCGRMMGAELKKGNRLEKVLEAALTVAAAALKKGDYVSVLAFSKEIKVFVPPAKGMAHLQTILQAIFDVKVDAAESNYAAVFQYLEIVQKKRSLLLLFSDVRTFLHEESALLYLKRLRQRHLFFMMGIEDQTLINRIKEEPKDVQTVMMKSIAQQQMLIKKREKIKWEKQGLQMVEAREEKLAIAAVSHYIDIMNQNLL
ncbi:DUF58 domain-containing protein [Neobacillus massiliamazoniensis]|uniref:VWFA domain-containing protein n=1 Tax=Neobacillus massiliamazoniensis TaxID=1499688 RepID=A0A0U1NYU4_9BACI|nr:DUF58 domain-containing protein [Neobacillus massiliamazoniensis]CRK83200.1 Hypothetical protein BN000_03160 [Neobacillus massiliamazoniensis]